MNANAQPPPPNQPEQVRGTTGRSSNNAQTLHELAGLFAQVIEQGEDEPLRVAIWRANAYRNYGLALDPEATRQVLEATDEGTSASSE